MKRKTNLDAVKHLMSYSNYGALSQAFVMEAIREKAESVSQHKAKDYPENSFVSPKAWIGVAKETKARLDRFYKTGELSL